VVYKQLGCFFLKKTTQPVFNKYLNNFLILRDILKSGLKLRRPSLKKNKKVEKFRFIVG